ncbi:MAG: LysE family transporter [Pseudomonadota bacterium]
MLSFALAVFLLMITPGPGVLSIAAVGSGFGLRRGLRYMAGLLMGSNIVAVAVMTGAAAVILAEPALRVLLSGLAALYLLWLAVRIASSAGRTQFSAATRAPGPVDGILLQLVNPKAYLVYLALFSGFAFLPEAPLQEGMIKLVLINLVWLPIHLAWLGLGIGLRRLAPSPTQQRRISLAMAIALVLAVVLSFGAQLPRTLLGG